LSDGRFSRILFAYEPIWAIGDGETARPDVAAHAHRLIRAQAKVRFGADAVNDVCILYGSVKPDNAKNGRPQAPLFLTAF
jgi:triosephosphate isomerase